MQQFFRSLFGQPSESLPIISPSNVKLPQPITRKVLVITHNPVLHSQGRRTLKEHFRWQDPHQLAQDPHQLAQDPHQLAQGYINDIREISFGYANYEIVGTYRSRCLSA